MKKILIIEDDFYIRDIYAKTFVAAGYLTEIAEDGEIGIEKALAQKYDIILLDIMLPERSGIQVLTAIRTSNSWNAETPIFLITNLGTETIIKQAFKLGADGYLLKSQLNPEDVVKEINNFL